MRLLNNALLGFLLLFTPFTLAQSAPVLEWETDNGAKSYLYKTDALPMVDIRLVFNAGAARDGEHPGVANMVSSLLDTGAGDLNVEAFTEALETTGAQLNVGSLRDMAWVSLRSLKDDKYLQPAMRLVETMLGKPRFDKSELSRLKDQFSVSLKASEKNPRSVTKRTVNRLFYQSHPYASDPKDEDYRALTQQQIKDFYHQYYVAKNVVISIVGDIDESAAKDIARRLSAVLNEGEAAQRLPQVEQTAQQIEHVLLPTEQAQIVMGMPLIKRGDPDYYQLLIGNYIFGGGGFSSRLMEELREKNGLVYGVSSGLSPMAAEGPFSINLQTRNDQAQKAIKMVNTELHKFISEGPTEQEVRKAIDFMLGSSPRRLDSNADWVQHLSLIGFYGLPLDYFEQLDQAMASLTRDQVHDAFVRRIDLNKMITVVVGSEAALSE